MLHNFDLVIIGSGPGGYVAGIRGAQLGLKVAIVERDKLGGICLNWGCIPTKALLKSSEVFRTVKESNSYGITTKDLNFEISSIVSRSKKIAMQLSDGVNYLLKKNNIKTFFGEATISGKKEVTVVCSNETIRLNASNIIIAAGARAKQPFKIGDKSKRIWTYKEALRPDNVPKSLLIVGSGAIGVEFASFYSSLGAKTTIVELQDNFLPNEDTEISDFVKKQFEIQGIKIKPKTLLKNLRETKTDVQATLVCEGQEISQSFETCILALGIIGNIETLGLKAVGIETEKGHIKTDEYCRTNIENIWAIGDITGAPWLAHKASNEGVMVVEKIVGLNPSSIDKNNIPNCTYSYPQIASVGLTEKGAEAAGYVFRVGRFPFVGNGKALAIGEPDGLVKTIFDASTGELLGAHLAGSQVTELIHGFTIGKTLETTEEDLFRVIFPHPTLSEMIQESALDAYDQAIHF